AGARRMLGIASGETRIPSPTMRALRVMRWRANDASVPMTRARGVTRPDTWNEVTIARCHPASTMRFSYQRNENPGGGNWKVVPLDRLIGTMSTAGSRSSADTRITEMPSGDQGRIGFVFI